MYLPENKGWLLVPRCTRESSVCYHNQTSLQVHLVIQKVSKMKHVIQKKRRQKNTTTKTTNKQYMHIDLITFSAKTIIHSSYEESAGRYRWLFPARRKYNCHGVNYHDYTLIEYASSDLDIRIMCFKMF